PVPCLLGHQRHCDSQGHAKIAAGKGFGEAGVGEISSGGWRLHAGRYLGSLPRVGWASQGIHLSSWWTEEAEPPLNNLGGLQESWPSDRKSTRLNSSHVAISYAVFCLKK